MLDYTHQRPSNIEWYLDFLRSQDKGGFDWSKQLINHLSFATKLEVEFVRSQEEHQLQAVTPTRNDKRELIAIDNMTQPHELTLLRFQLTRYW